MRIQLLDQPNHTPFCLAVSPENRVVVRFWGRGGFAGLRASLKRPQERSTRFSSDETAGSRTSLQRALQWSLRQAHWRSSDAATVEADRTPE